jgi:hypothetical protein
MKPYLRGKAVDGLPSQIHARGPIGQEARRESAFVTGLTNTRSERLDLVKGGSRVGETFQNCRPPWYGGVNFRRTATRALHS